jgi:DnaJ-domain-containing protein 1
MRWWDVAYKAIEVARNSLPPCHICGEAGAQLCAECGKIACHKHAFTNVGALKSVCNECMGKHFPFVSRMDIDLSQWPYNEAPWEVLGVSPNATEKEIRAAQRELSRKYHPDHGGDAKRQAAVNEAAEFMLCTA